MGCKDWLVALPFAAVCIAGCGQKAASPVQEETEVDSLLLINESDTLSVTEETEEKMPEKADGTFDDFLFNFVRSERLQLERVQFPLPVIMADSTRKLMNKDEWTDEFYFLSDADFYTVLWNTEQQIEEEKRDTACHVVSVDNILLVSQELRRYDFVKEQGKWMLVRMRLLPIDYGDTGDFLTFYSKFASDSLYCEEHITPHLKVNLSDPVDEMERIEGTIEREQFPLFCPDVPDVSISNIRYGQPYGDSLRMVMQKTSAGNEMQEIFTFEKGVRGWRLVKYEN